MNLPAPLIAVFAFALLTAAADDPEIPKCVDPGVKISLVAQHPDVVTPTGIAVDSNGRVFVLENHTHFRPGDYDGPERDRILILGKTGKPSVFYEGFTFGTDLLFDSRGNLFVTTRARVAVFRNAAFLDEAQGEPELLVDLLTTGQYPHNGVSGLALPGNEALLYFGFGENLGAKYTFVGSDGARVSGGGEGGSVYRCQTDGSKLERIATGFWNPFGMTFDSGGNLFAVGNDPGSSPPCRLMHIVDGADFGYEYRYGRSGLHPLITWNGEIPGTLPMAGGTGEAPCGVIPMGNDLLVASWADHRIDLHVLEPSGASFKAERKPFIQGGNEFRPVHLAWAPDRKTLYFTDWVSASYQLHKLGRVWKIEFPKSFPKFTGPAPTAEADMAASLRDGGRSFEDCVAALASDDPFIRSAAIHGLGKNREKLSDYKWRKSKSARGRANFGVALKRHGGEAAREQVSFFLQDPSSDVRFVGIKWIADDMLEDHRKELAGMLKSPNLGQREFLAVMAALDRLDGTKKIRDVPDPEKLLGVVANADLSPRLRALALRMIPPDHKALTVKKLAVLFTSEERAIQLEAIRSLQQHPDAERGDLLLEAGRDESMSPEIRLEAIAGLAPLADRFREELIALAKSRDSAIAAEAKRALAGLESLPADIARSPGEKPPMHDVDAWVEWVGEDLSGADSKAGRRLFYHAKLGTCQRCHQMEGRGVRVGPDLTTIHERGDARWLLETILLPNKDIAPQFLPWSIQMEDGESYIGLPLRKGGTKEAYLGIDGKEFSLRKDNMVSHQEMQISLMPMGLLDPLTREEIRDLLAYLQEMR